MSPIAAMSAAAVTKLTPGEGEQPPHLRRSEHLLGERALDQGDLAVEERDLAQAGRDRLLLVGGQGLLGEPAAPARRSAGAGSASAHPAARPPAKSRRRAASPACARRSCPSLRPHG